MKKLSILLSLFAFLAFAAACNGNGGKKDADADEDVQDDEEPGDVTPDPDAEEDAEPDPEPDVEPDAEEEPDAQEDVPPEVPDAEDGGEDGGELCDSIADVRAAADGTVDLDLCNVMVTYVFGSGYFVQAETEGPAIEVYEGDDWTSDVEVGHEITMHVTNVASYHGTKEIDAHDAITVDSTGNDVSGLEQNITTLDVPPSEDLECELVRVTEATTTDVDGRNVTISYGGQTGVLMRVNDSSILCVGATFNVLAVVNEWDGAHRVESFADEDFYDIDTSGCGGGGREPVAGELLINEFLADPAAGDPGDANCDGTRDDSDDEFVEIVNITTDVLSLEGVVISDEFGDRHTFSAADSLDPGKVVVVYGGGTPGCTVWPSDVLVVTASTGALGLNNGGDTITLTNPSADVIVAYTFAGEGGNDESLTLNPDLDDEDATATGISGFEGHSTADTADGSLFSPGTKIDETPF